MKWWFSSWNLFLFSLSKVCRISSADCFISGFTASQSTLFCNAKYNMLHFAQWLSVLLRICFQSFLPLRRVILIVICHCFTSRKTTKKPLTIFYHRLKTQVLSFNFRYIMHLRFVSMDKKIRAISVAFIGSFFARILIPIIKFLVDFIWKIVPQQNPRRNLSFLTISTPVAELLHLIATLW